MTTFAPVEADRLRRRPPALRPGARIALVAPAGPVRAERLASALEHCARFGFEAVPGSAIRQRTGYLAGDDAERLADLQRALDDPAIDGIWALRGGYGTMRLLPRLRLPPVPKAYIGFSDNTALHLWLDRAGMVSFHAPHPGADFTPLALDCFRRVLLRPEPAGILPQAPETPVRTLVGGSAEGTLVGGNLALVAALCGTPWQPDARGRILFLEDVGEAPYRLDRLLRQLELSGVLGNVAGLALGQFTECDGDPGDPDAIALLEEAAVRAGVPAVLGLPIGHVPDNWTLPLGVRAHLDADAGTLALLEAAVEGQ
jgi:muramoyltetrapeptide carboxypeptidase